jgi:hypothetical protein
MKTKTTGKTPTTSKKAPTVYLRASAWQIWQQCALSLTLKDDSPFKPEQDEFAAEGTAIHAAIESDLKGEPRTKSDDPETEAVIDFAVRVAQSEAAGLPIRTEVFTDAKLKAATIGGTVDAKIDADDTLTIIDFKTGWKKVEAENNAQLKIYAHLNQKRGQKQWRGIIINARLNSISMTGPHPFEKDYLSNLASEAAKRAAAKQTQVGNHCAYCPALTVCVPVRDAIKKWLQPGADDGIKNRKADWSELLNLAKPAETLFKRVKSDALKYVELGGELPGVSIEYSGGSRAWPRDLNPVALADRLGVDEKKITESYVISPAEAEKKGIDREAIQRVAIQPMRRGLKVTTVKKDKAGE